MTTATDRRSTAMSGSALIERLPAVLRSRRALGWALRLTDLAGIIFIYRLAFWLRSGEYTINLLHSQRWMVLLLVAIAVLGDSGRPVLFSQSRVGFGGKRFTCYKFEP